MFVQNVIKMSAEVHELSCPQAFLPYLAMVNNPSNNPVLWSWPWNCLGVVRLSRDMFMLNWVKLSAAVHELSWVQRKKLRRTQYSLSLPCGQ